MKSNRSKLIVVALTIGLAVGIAPSPAHAASPDRLFATRAPSETPQQAPGSAHGVIAPTIRPGSQLWASTLTEGTEAASLGVSPDGRAVFVTGESDSFDVLTIAHRARSGAILWQAEYDGPAHLSDGANALAVSPDGTKVFVTGGTIVHGFIGDALTIAYDARTGEQLWVSQYSAGGNGNDNAIAVAVSGDGGRVFIVGTSDGPGTGSDFLTVAYDAATGEQLWASRYTGPGDGVDIARAVAATPDGTRLYTAGWSPGASHVNDAVTIGYDAASGTELWVSRYRGPAGFTDQAFDTAVAPDGSRVYTAGTSQHAQSMTAFDTLTIAYDATTGAEEWVSVFNSPEDALDVLNAVKPSPDGSLVYVTGQSGDLGDITTIAYGAAAGDQAWLARFPGQSFAVEGGCCLTVNGNGTKLYVAGSTSADGWDFVVLSYDALSGTQRWSARYGGQSNGFDLPRAIGLIPSGSLVFVTGTSTGGVQQDYVTLAFVA